MIWQMMLMNLVFMIGGFLFVVALCPSVTSKDKPAWKTSALTGGVLVCYAVVQAMNGLWLAFLATFLTSLMWWVLFFQKVGKND